MSTDLGPFRSEGSRRDEDQAPRFCPRCVRARRVEGNLCPECGEKLLRQTFCGVCDAFWPRPAGAFCPKHEIPLEEGRPLDEFGEAHAAWTTLRIYSDTLAAEGPRMRLAAEGIPTFLEGERMGMRSMYHVAAGGVKLQVPESLLADARVILAQNWQPVVDDLDDAWEELAAEPGQHWRALVFVGYAVFLIVALLAAGTLVLVWVAAGVGA